MARPAPEHLLDRRVSVQRASIVTGPSGTPVRQWQTLISSTPARVEPLTAGTSTRASAGVHRRRFRLFVGQQCDVARGDRIRDGGVVMAVLAVYPRTAPAGLASVIAEEVVE